MVVVVVGGVVVVFEEETSNVGMDGVDRDLRLFVDIIVLYAECVNC